MPSEVGGIKGCRPPQDLTKLGNPTLGGGERFRSGYARSEAVNTNPAARGSAHRQKALRQKG